MYGLAFYLNSLLQIKAKFALAGTTNFEYGRAAFETGGGWLDSAVTPNTQGKMYANICTKYLIILLWISHLPVLEEVTLSWSAKIVGMWQLYISHQPNDILLTYMFPLVGPALFPGCLFLEAPLIWVFTAQTVFQWGFRVCHELSSQLLLSLAFLFCSYLCNNAVHLMPPQIFTGSSVGWLILLISL